MAFLSYIDANYRNMALTILISFLDLTTKTFWSFHRLGFHKAKILKKR